MSELLTNIGTILTNLIDWFTQIGSYLINNPIFQIVLGTGIFLLIVRLIIKIKDEMMARELAIGLTGSTQDLEYWRKHNNGR